VLSSLVGNLKEKKKKKGIAEPLYPRFYTIDTILKKDFFFFHTENSNKLKNKYNKSWIP